MKKLINLLLVSLMILSLSGCSKSNEELSNNDITKNESNSNKEQANNVQNKPTTQNKNNSTSSNNNDSSKNNTVTHSHTWNEIYEIIKHDEVGHYETVTIQEAWDEVIVIQEAWDEKVIDQEYIAPTLVRIVECNRCGRFGNIGKCTMPGCGGIVYEKSWEEGGQEEISHIVHHEAIYNIIHHESVKKEKWVIDKEAYEERIVAGYKCSKCGEFKN